MMASLDEQQRILVLTAAVEGLALLAKGLRRRGANCHLCEYSPDVVRFHLAHWRELKSATEGCSAAGANPIGGGIRDRMRLAAILADLEAATDQALEPLLRWQSVSRIYKRQERFSRYLALRRVALLNLHHPEPSAPLAEAICLEAIARALGWYRHEPCEGED
jgi:hypothetical protein